MMKGLSILLKYGFIFGYCYLCWKLYCRFNSFFIAFIGGALLIFIVVILLFMNIMEDFTLF